MNEDSFLSTPSPHEAFSMMLLERIERMEDEQRTLKETITNLKETLGDHIPAEWYKFVFTMPALPDTLPPVSPTDYSNALYYDKIRETCINRLFSTRSDTKPLFSFWKWKLCVNEPAEDFKKDEFKIWVYVRWESWKPVSYFKGLLGDLPSVIQTICKDKHMPTKLPSVEIYPLQGGIVEVQLALTEKVGYIMNIRTNIMPYGFPENGIDIWRRGGTPRYPLEKNWTTGAFLESPNYKHPITEKQSFLNFMADMVQRNQVQYWYQLFLFAITNE
jgi:hypothetical protein